MCGVQGVGFRVEGWGRRVFGFRVSDLEVFEFRFESVGARACCFRVWYLGERRVLKREGEKERERSEPTRFRYQHSRHVYPHTENARSK